MSPSAVSKHHVSGICNLYEKGNATYHKELRVVHACGVSGIFDGIDKWYARMSDTSASPKIAQLVERKAHILEVLGSSPTLGVGRYPSFLVADEQMHT
jgi:hypothetical protein